MSFCFPKSARLRKRFQYQRMANQSRRHVGYWIIIESRQNQESTNRLGITVTRRYGKAHERNRFKRIIREGFRLVQSNLIPDLDLNIRPRSSAKNAKTSDIMKELVYLIGQKTHGR